MKTLLPLYSTFINYFSKILAYLLSIPWSSFSFT